MRSNSFAASSSLPSAPALFTLASSSASSLRNSSTVTLRPSSSTPFGERIHCQICEREISAVAASSIRLYTGTQPLPASQSAMYWIPTEMLLRMPASRSEEHTSELQSQSNLVCRLLLEKKKKKKKKTKKTINNNK